MEEMCIIGAGCYKCDAPMKVALIRGDFYKRGGTTVGPASFSDEELLLARSEGALIELHYSQTRDEKYLANTCPSCRAFVGEHYLFTDYYNPAELGKYEYKRIKL